MKKDIDNIDAMEIVTALKLTIISMVDNQLENTVQMRVNNQQLSSIPQKSTKDENVTVPLIGPDSDSSEVIRFSVMPKDEESVIKHIWVFQDKRSPNNSIKGYVGQVFDYNAAEDVRGRNTGGGTKPLSIKKIDGSYVLTLF
ncbi:hypothetical protein [Photorhabdus hindustanensis]|uniref:Uncharacterized protein n=1 Tax=Photorhabdus hindustanensis TaxID=2918802 RepID=A0A2S8Q9V6_9GAMM|nr:hypothetical protein [Photorhabdus hindustanensis]PQQ30038.1 hypothetical protein C6H66_00615 [Photorhabdus hindustanensis]